MTWGLNVRGTEGLGGLDERMRLTVYGNKVKVRFLGDEGRLDRFKPRPYSGASLFRHIFSTEEKATGSFCVCDEQRRWKIRNQGERVSCAIWVGLVAELGG